MVGVEQLAKIESGVCSALSWLIQGVLPDMAAEMIAASSEYPSTARQPAAAVAE